MTHPDADAPQQSWTDFTAAQAAELKLNLAHRTDITAPLNEAGEPCPWPWEPQQLVGAPLGQYHCGYCGAMVIAGMPHLDYRPEETTMTAEPRRHDCPNCDPTPAVSTETVRGGRRLNTSANAARSDHPVPERAARAHARYDTDPDALAWARTKVQHQLDRLAAFERDAIETGRPETAAGLSVARRSTAQMLIGGEGCVVGAFDERRPLMFAAPSADGGGV